MAETLRPAVYIPNLDAEALLPRTLESLRGQTRPVDVVLVDNGSTDGSVPLTRERFAEVEVLEMGQNLGFGPAINRAVRERPADPVILLNNDIECEPGMIEAMLDTQADGVQSVAGILLQERDPTRIDSAGVVADTTLMGFDHLHGEPVAYAATAPAPLGPTGGAALYSKAAFEAVGGFDERIFLYYEDLDLALRMAADGGALPPRPRSAGRTRLLGEPRRRQRREVRADRMDPGLHAPPLRRDVEPSAGAASTRLRGGALRRPIAARSHRPRGRRSHRGLAGRRRARAPRCRRRPLLDITAREAIRLRRRRRD